MLILKRTKRKERNPVTMTVFMILKVMMNIVENLTERKDIIIDQITEDQITEEEINMMMIGITIPEMIIRKEVVIGKDKEGTEGITEGVMMIVEEEEAITIESKEGIMTENKAAIKTEEKEDTKAEKMTTLTIIMTIKEK